MNCTRISRFVLSAAVSMLACSAAQAGLFRAYLASTGSDSNPCTVAAPCRLLPAALLAVNDGGEVWMLDSANYNTAPVTIDKSVTILAIPGAVGSLVSTTASTSVVTVNGAGAKVTLNNVVVVPFTTPWDGVTLSQGTSLTLDRCRIAGMANRSISVTTSAFLRVVDSIVEDTNFGVVVENGASGQVANTKFLGISSAGVYAFGNNHTSTTTKINVSDSVIQGISRVAGWALLADSSDATIVTSASITRSTVTNIGVAAESNGTTGGTPLVTVSSNTMVHNGTGIQQVGTGVLNSMGDNTVVDNTFNSLGSITPVAKM
jgi:hypothetical protein